MLRLTVSLGLAAGVGVLAAGAFPTAALHAAPEQAAEDPAAEWEARWAKVHKDAAKEYANLAKKYEKNLEATAFSMRWRILRYLPDDPETRANLGYVKREGGGWERNEVVHDKLKELTDLDDPKSTKFTVDLKAADNKVAVMFKGLASKAVENGAAKNASPDAKWSEKAARAWEAVLDVGDTADNKLAEDAHKALGHPQFEKRYVSPYKLQFMKNRADRKALGTKEQAAAVKPCDAVEVDGKFKDAGLAGGGAKSTMFTVNAVHGKDLALRLAADCEKGVTDVLAVYGFPEGVKDRIAVRKLDIVKEKEEYKKFLITGFAWTEAKVQKYIERFHHVGLGAELLSMTSGGADSDDVAMNNVVVSTVTAAQSMASTDVGSATKPVKQGGEDWLWQSIAYDVTRRVLGTSLTTYGTFGKYGDAPDSRPGEDKWIELARRFVQTDEDVPISTLPKLLVENQDFKGPQMVKGWALLQFLFEMDAEKAKAFIWQALANGTPAAVVAVYPDDAANPDAAKSMEKLDAEYRRWIQKAW